MINKDELTKKIKVKSKRNLLTIIDIVFWVYMAIVLLFVIKDCFAEIEDFGGWEQVKSQFSTMEIVIKFIIYIVASVVLGHFLSILIHIAMKLAIKKFAEDRLSPIDFKKYEGYFRDILKNYSPAELSYIDNFELSYKNDVVATLLSLKLKGAISFDENSSTIQVLNNSLPNLSQSEKYILNGIKDGKLVDYSDEVFKSKVFEDSLRTGILETKSAKKINFMKYFAFTVAIIVALIIIAIYLFTIVYNDPTKVEGPIMLLLIGVMMLLFYFPIALIIYAVTYILKASGNGYVRSKKGEMINERIEGLKNYIKDYSSLDEKDKNDVIIWEDYLIYSVIFKQNTDIVNSTWNKYVKSY